MPMMIPFGAYVLLDRLGEGSQGDVFLARPSSGQVRPIVIKRLASQHLGKKSFVRRFKHEGLIAMAIDSPNVVRVLDVGQVGDWVYIAMEYVAGRTIAKVVAELARDEDYPSLSSIADVITGALEGLHAIHDAVGPDGSGLEIVHRDVAPKNLMLSDEGVTKVIDLGLGKSTLQDWRTATGVVMGTPGYLAPEQATGGTVDRRADVFAMGAIFFEMLTFKRYIPIRPIVEMLAVSVRSHYRAPSSIRPEIPPALDEIVRRALEVDPADRFQTAKEMADAIRGSIPIRVDQPARSLLDQLEWNDVAHTKAAVLELISDKSVDSVSTLQVDSSAVLPRRKWSGPMLIAALVVLLIGVGAGLWLVDPIATSAPLETREVAEDPPPTPKPPAVVPKQHLDAPPPDLTPPDLTPPDPTPPDPAPPPQEKAVKPARGKRPPTKKDVSAPADPPPPPPAILDVEI
jgi:eukaryotic-like serine/threonine-protein kinase